MDRPQPNDETREAQAEAPREAPLSAAGRQPPSPHGEGLDRGERQPEDRAASKAGLAHAAERGSEGDGQAYDDDYDADTFAGGSGYGSDFDDDFDSGFGRPYSRSGVGGPDDAMSAVQRDAAQGVTQHEGLVGRAIEALRAVYDPEIPVNIYDLGLIYEVKEVEAGKILVRMTLTSPMCPVAGSLPPDVKHQVESAPGVKEAVVEIVWDPPWSPDKMSEAARLQLNFF